jgi:hypothetical protein
LIFFAAETTDTASRGGHSKSLPLRIGIDLAARMSF